MEMEQFSRKNPADRDPARYIVRALVTGKSTIGGMDCWNLAFVHGERTPPELENSYSLSVAKETGWPLKIIHSKQLKRVPENMLAASNFALGHAYNNLGIVGVTPMLRSGYIKPTEQIAWLERFGGASFITAAPEGYPVEIFPLHELGQFSSSKSGATLTLRNEKKDGFIIVEAVLTFGEKDRLLIRQKWIEGEKWWREYERYVDGRKDLYARQVMPPVVKAAPIVDPGKPDPLYLRRDPKLQVVVEIEERGAKLSVLLQRMNRATGLTLTLDANLVNHRPDLGFVQSSKQGYRAYDVMGIIERAQLENGRWLKTEQGYKLTGVSKAPMPAVSTEKATEVEPESRPSGGAMSWLIGGGAILGVFLFAGAGYGILRWRQKPRTDRLPTQAVKVAPKKEPVPRLPGGKRAKPS
jgi:hypothetical protein